MHVAEAPMSRRPSAKGSHGSIGVVAKRSKRRGPKGGLLGLSKGRLSLGGKALSSSRRVQILLPRALSRRSYQVSEIREDLRMEWQHDGSFGGGLGLVDRGGRLEEGASVWTDLFGDLFGSGPSANSRGKLVPTNRPGTLPNPSELRNACLSREAGEMVEFAGGVKGIALNLENENVGIVVFGQGYAKGRWSMVWEYLLMEGGSQRSRAKTCEVKAPGIIELKSVHEPACKQRFKAVDSPVPMSVVVNKNL
ncbi:hypothetical protein RND71_015917 [Anisodus tanguticus]|uniref:ATPase F1/V1/A1 complex alpha/beta subunit N-terminal domain-containing protein n=1 Tax=Anisodus tanguticus TaxID=243964 RepID=A0AAE1S561_9SOLA|nr:hypothetical protein RND71_015917 [Anisodus tanguticus]